MSEFKLPQFDAEVRQVLEAFARVKDAELGPFVRIRLQAAFMDGVLAALERALARGIDLGPESVKGGPRDEANPLGYDR